MNYMFVQSVNTDTIMTNNAYNWLKLQMTTIDYHNHTAMPVVPAMAAHFGYVDIDDDGEFIEVLGEVANG